ncbi:unnamed protein product, partial [Ectocarpus sp. 4 AP-2014]
FPPSSQAVFPALEPINAPRVCSEGSVASPELTVKPSKVSGGGDGFERTFSNGLCAFAPPLVGLAPTYGIPRLGCYPYITPLFSYASLRFFGTLRHSAGPPLSLSLSVSPPPLPLPLSLLTGGLPPRVGELQAPPEARHTVRQPHRPALREAHAREPPERERLRPGLSGGSDAARSQIVDGDDDHALVGACISPIHCRDLIEPIPFDFKYVSNRKSLFDCHVDILIPVLQ